MASRLLAVLQLRDAAAATSAFGLAVRDSQGRAMNPIVDPRRGIPRRGGTSVTVAARSCAQADGLRKVVALQGRRAEPLLRALRASALVASSRGRITRLGATNGK